MYYTPDRIEEEPYCPPGDDCFVCQGTGKIYFSLCCGAEVIDGVCQDLDCLQNCQITHEKCDECDGEGELYL